MGRAYGLVSNPRYVVYIIYGENYAHIYAEELRARVQRFTRSMQLFTHARA